jgi:hypothetical protein
MLVLPDAARSALLTRTPSTRPLRPWDGTAPPATAVSSATTGIGQPWLGAAGDPTSKVVDVLSYVLLARWWFRSSRWV